MSMTPLSQLAAAVVNNVRLECRLDRWRDGAVQPCAGLAVLGRDPLPGAAHRHKRRWPASRQAVL